MVSFSPITTDMTSKRYKHLLSYMGQLEGLMEQDAEIFYKNDLELTREHVRKKDEISSAYRQELALLLQSPDASSLSPEAKSLFRENFHRFMAKLTDNLVLLSAQEQELTQRINHRYDILKEEHTRSSAFYNRHGQSSQVLKSVQLSKNI